MHFLRTTLFFFAGSSALIAASPVSLDPNTRGIMTRDDEGVDIADGFKRDVESGDGVDVADGFKRDVQGQSGDGGEGVDVADGF